MSETPLSLETAVPPNTATVGRSSRRRIREGRFAGPAGALLLALLGLAQAQNYSIDWHTIDGGGGTSTGGVYTVSGTIGQPDAGTMSGGPYTLTGGFWALPVAVQSSNAPTLIITPATAGFATVSWAPATPGFVLQETVSLVVAWTNSPSGAANPVTVPAALPARYYRLFKP